MVPVPQDDFVDVLLTVGSTEFSTLVESFLFTFTLDAVYTLALSQRLLSQASAISKEPAIVKVLAQVGKSELPSGWRIGFKKIRNGGARGVTNLDVTVVDFVPDLESKVSTTPLVISHAGAGSILSFIRLADADEKSIQAERQLIVIPNDTLMDSHQSDLAEEMSKNQWALVSSARKLPDFLRDLVQQRTAFVESDGKPIQLPNLNKPPPFDSTKFSRIVDETLCYK